MAQYGHVLHHNHSMLSPQMLEMKKSGKMKKQSRTEPRLMRRGSAANLQAKRGLVAFPSEGSCENKHVGKYTQRTNRHPQHTC